MLDQLPHDISRATVGLLTQSSKCEGCHLILVGVGTSSRHTTYGEMDRQRATLAAHRDIRNGTVFEQQRHGLSVCLPALLTTIITIHSLDLSIERRVVSPRTARCKQVRSSLSAARGLARRDSSSSTISLWPFQLLDSRDACHSPTRMHVVTGILSCSWIRTASVRGVSWVEFCSSDAVSRCVIDRRQSTANHLDRTVPQPRALGHIVAGSRSISSVRTLPKSIDEFVHQHEALRRV